MNLQNLMREHREKIIYAGLGVGFASLFEMLPEEIFFVGSYTNFVYLGLVGLAAYVFYEYYTSDNSKNSFPRTVPSRNLSSPTYQKQLRRSHPSMQQPPELNVPENSRAPINVPKNSTVFDDFNKEK